MLKLFINDIQYLGTVKKKSQKRKTKHPTESNQWSSRQKLCL